MSLVLFFSEKMYSESGFSFELMNSIALSGVSAIIIGRMGPNISS